MAKDDTKKQHNQQNTSHKKKKDVFEDIYAQVNVDDMEISIPDITMTSSTKNIPQKFNIDDIGAYIASTKTKQTDGGAPLAKDGTDITTLPGLYAVVPHAKGDHKLIYMRDTAPKDLIDDKKGRKKGDIYTKKNIKIYDVYVDFKEHPYLQNSIGEALGVWIIDDPKDLEQQLAAIHQGKGGGINFSEPMLLESPVQNKKEEPKKEEPKKEEPKKEEPKKEEPKKEEPKKEEPKKEEPKKEEPKKEEPKPWVKQIEEKKDQEKKPRQEPVQQKQMQEKKPWAEQVEEKKDQEKKPRQDPVQQKQDEEKPWLAKNTPTIGTTTSGEQTTAENTLIHTTHTTAIENQEPAIDNTLIPEQPFYNAVDKTHERDMHKQQTPTPIDLDASIVPQKELPTKQKNTIKEENTPGLQQEHKDQTINIDKVATPPLQQTPDSTASTNTGKEKEVQELLTDNKATIDDFIEKAPTTVYPEAQVTKTLTKNTSIPTKNNEKSAQYKQVKTTRQKVRILLSMFFFLVVLGILIWFIRFMFFSNTNPEEQTISMPDTTINNTNNNLVPEVIPEEEALNNTPPADTPTNTETEETGNPNTLPKEDDEKDTLEEVFTLPELSAKLEAQQKEAQRLAKDAKFIGDKEAIMFATTAAIKANSVLSNIEKNPNITASEVQADAEKIDYYLQEANKLLQ